MMGVHAEGSWDDVFEVPVYRSPRCGGERDGRVCGTRLRRTNSGALCEACERRQQQEIIRRHDALADATSRPVAEGLCTRCFGPVHRGLCVGTNSWRDLGGMNG